MRERENIMGHRRDLTNVSLFLFMVLGVLSLVYALAQGQDASHSPDLSSLSDDDLKTVTIQLERRACYGVCPAYSITIHGDGRVEYEGKNHVKTKGTQQGQIEKNQIRALVSEFAKTKFWEIDEAYSETKCKGRYCTDMATVITEIRIKATVHRVEHYYGCGGAPKSLFDLESQIDKSAHSEKWTGDVTKAGPFGTTCSGGD